MSASNTITQSAPAFPVEPLLEGDLRVLVRYTQDHPVLGLGLDDEGETIDRGLLLEELRFSGLSPMQARREVTHEAIRQQWIAQAEERASALEQTASAWHRATATRGGVNALRTNTDVRWARSGLWRALAGAVVVSIIAGILTWFLTARGMSLTAPAWVIGVATLLLGAAAGLIVWRLGRDAKPVDPAVVAQAVVAFELSAIFAGPEIATHAEMSERLGRSPVSEGQMGDAEAVLVDASAAAYWSYRALVEDVVASASPAADLGRARAHLDALVAIESNYGADPAIARANVDVLENDSMTGEVTVTAVVTFVVTALVAGAVLALPSFFIASSKCAFAQASVRIAECKDLVGLDAAGADLTDAKLADRDLTDANFTEANLTQADLSRATLTTANLHAAKLPKAKLISADLTGADLSGADLTDADLTGADLTGADLVGVTLGASNLSNAKLSGADLTGVDLTKAKLAGVDLTNAILDNSNLSGVKADGMNLAGSSLAGANLSNASMAKANLSGTYLTGANLTGLKIAGATLDGIPVQVLLDGKANMEGALLAGVDFNGVSGQPLNLQKVNMDGVNLSGLDLTKVNFDGSSLIGADLSESDLRGASLKDAVLAEASLELADASEAIMSGADLRNARLGSLRALKTDLRNSMMAMANLEGADFSSANLTGATGLGGNANGAMWRGATCPNGQKAEICRS